MNRMYKIILSSFYISCFSYVPTNCFQTLDELQSYTLSIPEAPEPDNNNWLKPDYTAYFESLEPSLVSKIISSLKRFFSKQEAYQWSPELIKNLLIDLTASRERQGYRGRFVLAGIPAADSTIIVWTDLLGAFHSLVRDLEELYKKHIINSNLEIVKEHCFFVFDGNTFDGSASVLELLTLVLVLMQKNPDKVLYLKGPQETNEAWKDTTLLQEINMRIPASFNLKELISKFFNTLPQALYLQAKADYELVKISAAIADQTGISDLNIRESLSTAQEGIIKKIPINELKSTTTSELVKVIITNANRDIIYTPTSGLELLPADKGVTAWRLFSGGSQASAKLYGFYNDAFATIHTGVNLKDWTITLHKQDWRTKTGFETRSFNLLTGLELELKKTPEYKQKIVFGCTLDLTKTLATLAKEVQKGLELFVYKRNQDPVDHRYIKLIFLNDEYTPRLTLKNAQEFLKNYRSHLFLSPFGTSTTEVFLPMVRKKEVLVLFPYTGASIFRNPDLTHMLHIRTSYDNEARALIHYAINTVRAEKFALFYQDDAFGQGPVRAARKLLEQAGIKQIIETPYMRNSTDMGKPAKEITEFDPDVIMFFSVYAPSTELIRKIGIDHLSSKVLMSISSLSDAFKEFVKSKGLELINSHVFPNPQNSMLKLVQEYRADMAQHNKERDFTSDSLEGYVNAQVLGYLLDNVKGQVTMDALIEQAEAIKNFDFKGLKLNFNPETRELLDKVWLDTGQEAWVSISTENKKHD